MLINSRTQLINYLHSNPKIGISKEYHEWTKCDSNFKVQLTQIGHIASNEQKAINSDYWGKDTSIDFSKYPYNNIKIYQHPLSRELYFMYIELGGHSPELRIRLIRKELIV